MMFLRTLIFITLAATASSFAPTIVQKSSSTALGVISRRDALMGGIASVLLLPNQAANAKAASTFFFDEKIEQVFEPSQMRTDGRIDLNSAFVGEYKELPGMFPHAAGKIASNGPFATVQDIYKIEGLTENDIKLFKKYEKEFTANPPGRAFDERINGRVST